ncbi:transforming acidic coiled-coil-containing protein 3-like isoform X2 [Corticium candelabrum]|uniref:transforming acidic coiled-coil-containing protein 3-like isoform X2 n=1 Tax=Corticium candelabrum TaxID=121492 RepID=UPI002E2690F8|nr:transforming acidic coiled-coil-containing protein 3-like isoform X2 [Corticium candelabrum]
MTGRSLKEENNFVDLLTGDLTRTKDVDLLGSLPAHANTLTATLLPTSILKPSQRENKSTAADVDKRKVTFREDYFKSDEVQADVEHSKWGDIRELDEQENWAERNQVVTKLEHEANCEILLDLVSKLPAFLKDRSMQHTSDEQRKEDFTDDEFRPASEVFGTGDDDKQFELDYLESLHSSIEPTAIALARQSLYVKFDPLVKEEMPDGAAFSLAMGTSSPDVESHSAVKLKDNLLQLNTPENTSVKRRVPKESILSRQVLSNTKDPVSVVEGSERLQGVDQLLFNSPKVTSSEETKESARDEPVESESGLVEVLVYTQLDLEERVDAAVKTAVENAAESLQAHHEQELLLMQAEVTRTDEQVVALKRENTELKSMVADHEKHAAQHRDLSDSKLADVAEARRERDVMLVDFNSIERAFADLLKRYERGKVINEKLKKDCEERDKSLEECRDKLTRSEQKYKSMKAQATEKITSAQNEVSKLNKAKQLEMAAMQANMKKESIRVATLERQLQDKGKEIQELSSICEDLMKTMNQNQ